MRKVKEIIDRLSSNDYPELTHVGKEYTKLDLINDLKELESQIAAKGKQELTITPELNAFLHGAGEIDGFRFGDFKRRQNLKVRFWWRKLLPPLPEAPSND